MIVATKCGEFSIGRRQLENTYMKYVRVDSIHWTDYNDVQLERLVRKMCRLHKPFHSHANLLLDVKIGDFNVGDYACFNTDWHYDCVKEYDHPTEHEHHTIYTNFCGTEFLKEDGSIVKAGDGEIWQYGRELHRCPKLDRAGRRILVRLTSTDLIKGVKHNDKPRT